jgi:hypothetical protein
MAFVPFRRLSGKENQGGVIINYGGVGREPLIMMVERDAPMINGVMHGKVRRGKNRSETFDSQNRLINVFFS